MRIKYFDYFRGITILLIIIGHCYYPWTIDTIPEKVIANLVIGNTALFVFISGFFFHRIFYNRIQYTDFLIKKIKNVFLPYLIFSSLAFIVFILILGRKSSFITGNTDGITNSILLFCKYLFTGQILAPYWYIPFIMIIFLMSPLFKRYICLSLTAQLSIYFALTIASTLIHRPHGNISPIHSVIYFTPIYLLGILYSIRENEIIQVIKNRYLLLGLATLSISIIQILYRKSFGNYHKSAILSYGGVDLIIIQKTLLIFFLLSILTKLKDKNIHILKYFAKISFPLYFLHPWFIELFNFLIINKHLLFIPKAAIFPIKTSLVIILSIAIAALIKNTLQKKSRYIIGY